jgi:hypothetical protein
MKNIYKIITLVIFLAAPAFLQGTVEQQFKKIKNMLYNKQSTFEKIKNELTSGDQAKKLLTFHNPNNELKFLRYTNNQATLLHHLTYSDEISIDLKIQLLDLFIQNGADIDAQAVNGETPLSLAVTYRKSSEFIEALLKHGADVNSKKIEFKNELTPLFIAVKNENRNHIRLLLEYGADCSITLNVGGEDLTAREYYKHFVRRPADETDDKIDALFATPSNPEKIAAIKKSLSKKGLDATDPLNPNTTSWSTASKVGISTLAIAAAVAGYYEYKKWQANKKADQKKKAE